MYVLAHVGITLLAWEAGRRLLARGATGASASPSAAPLMAVGVGAMLPDLVDKPLGHLVLGWDAGRLFAHTLLFTLLLCLGAACLLRRSPRGAAVLAALAFGSAAHLALDRMWLEPAVLLWPLLGEMPHPVWEPSRYLTTPVTSPWVLWMEGVGAVAVAAACWMAYGLPRWVTSVKKPTPVRRER